MKLRRRKRHEPAADHMSPSMLDHERGVEEARMRRAKARAEYLMQRAEEEQTRAEVYALNRLMRRREVVRFEAYVKARKLSRKRARAMRLAAEAAGESAGAIRDLAVPENPPAYDEEVSAAPSRARLLTRSLTLLSHPPPPHHATLPPCHTLC